MRMRPETAVPGEVEDLVRTSMGYYWPVSGRPVLDDVNEVHGHVLLTPNHTFELRTLNDDPDPTLFLGGRAAPLPEAVFGATPKSSVVLLPILGRGGSMNLGGFRASYTSYSSAAIMQSNRGRDATSRTAQAGRDYGDTQSQR